MPYESGVLDEPLPQSGTGPYLATQVMTSHGLVDS